MSLTASMMTEYGVLAVKTKPSFLAPFTNAASSVNRGDEALTLHRQWQTSVEHVLFLKSTKSPAAGGAWRTGAVVRTRL